MVKSSVLSCSYRRSSCVEMSFVTFSSRMNTSYKLFRAMHNSSAVGFRTKRPIQMCFVPSWQPETVHRLQSPRVIAMYCRANDYNLFIRQWVQVLHIKTLSNNHLGLNTLVCAQWSDLYQPTYYSRLVESSKAPGSPPPSSNYVTKIITLHNAGAGSPQSSGTV